MQFKAYADGAWSSCSVGLPACLVGHRHDKSNCGSVTATDTTEQISGYLWKSVGVAEASYCSHPGDSGGAVYNSGGVVGINITGDSDHNEPGTPGDCSSGFIPIGRMLSIFRKSYPTLTI